MEERINKIEIRNKRLEFDNAWEISTLRKMLIIILTYIFAVLYLTIADVTNPFFGAVILCVGFLLLTQTLKILKNYRVRRK